MASPLVCPDVLIDKIGLKTQDFRLIDRHGLSMQTTSNWLTDGSLHTTEKHFLNMPGQGFSIDVKLDKQQMPSCFITWNPNKADAPISDLCRSAGLILNVDRAALIRLDLARDKQLEFNPLLYHNVIRAAAGGHAKAEAFASTIRSGNKRGQVCFYDKSTESKLTIPGVCRLESRFLKPAAIGRYGLSVYADLAGSDLLQLYRKAVHHYLPNLLKLGSEVEAMGEHVRTLEMLYGQDNRPLVTFLTAYGLQSMGADYVLSLIKAADLTKQQKCNARKYVYKTIGKLSTSIEFGSLRADLLSYVA